MKNRRIGIIAIVSICLCATALTAGEYYQSSALTFPNLSAAAASLTHHKLPDTHPTPTPTHHPSHHTPSGTITQNNQIFLTMKGGE